MRYPMSISCLMYYLAIHDHAEVDPAANSVGENVKVAFSPWEKEEREIERRGKV